MIRIIFAFIVIIHGLIHLLGFLKEWKLAPIEQMNGATLFPLTGSLSKIAGTLWFFAAILFVFLAVIFLLKKDWWWIPAAITIFLSQILIILYWQDAKFGTIANIIILVACIVSYGSWNFNKIVDREINSFLQGQAEEVKIVNEQMINKLPGVVQKWLRHSNIIGKEMTQTVFLTQKGELKTSRDGKWLPFEARQYFTIGNPGYKYYRQIPPVILTLLPATFR